MNSVIRTNNRGHSVKCRKRHFSVDFLGGQLGEDRCMYISVALWFKI